MLPTKIIDTYKSDIGKPVSLGISEATEFRYFLKDSYASSRMCPCEGREGMAKTILFCSACYHTACTRCAGRPEHKYQEKLISREGQITPREFQHKHKNSIPTRVKLSGFDSKSLSEVYKQVQGEPKNLVENKLWNTWLEDFCAVEELEFRFISWTRGEAWMAIYEAGKYRLELILEKHEPKWLLYLPPKYGENRLQFLFFSRPAARLLLSKISESVLSGTWEICLPFVSTFEVTIKGGGPLVDTFEASLGLMPPFEDTKRHSEWTIDVKGTKDSKIFGSETSVSGRYILLENCGGPMNSIHKRVGTEKDMFFFLEESRTGRKDQDRFVFSSTYRRISFREQRGEVKKIPILLT